MVEKRIRLKEFPISKPRLYHPAPIVQGVSLTLSVAQLHYLKRVMRLQYNDPFCVFNKHDGEWIVRGDNKEKVRTFQAPLPLSLAFAPLMKTERMRFLIEKSTEIGVTKFIPLKTKYAHGRFDEKKAYAWAVEAAEQCERLDIPHFVPACSLEDLFKSETKWAVALERCCDRQGSLCPVEGLIIGPEGGFSEDEKAFLMQTHHGYILTLGPNILRAETAAIVGLTRIKSCEIPSTF